MAVKLNYRVENAQVCQRTRQLIVDGTSGLFTVDVLSVELLPDGHNGGTVTLELDPATEGFGEGAEVAVSFDLTTSVAVAPAGATASDDTPAPTPPTEA